jgi:hypothetical protein
MIRKISKTFGQFLSACSVRPPAALALFICLLVSAIAVHFYSVNWPLADDFIIIEWFRAYFIHHSTSFLDLFINASDGPHLLGVPAVLTIYLLRIFGINFNVIVAASFVFASIGAFILSSLILSDLKRCNNFIYWFLAIAISILFINPVQVHDLLWAFEICWILINLFLCINIFVIEKFAKIYYFIVPFTATAAFFCSAHGIFLWLAAILHILLKRETAHRRLFIGFAAIAFIIEAIVLSKMGGDAKLAMNDIPKLILYQLGLIGGEFGIRNTITASWLGLCLVSIFSVIAIWTCRRAPLSALDRIGIVFSITAFFMLAAFSKGRLENGLPWALQNFHAAALTAPFVLGVFLLCWSSISKNYNTIYIKAFSAVSMIFILSSILTSLPYAKDTAIDSKHFRELTLLESCSKTSSTYLRSHINGGIEASLPMIIRSMQTLEPLCQQTVSADVLRMAAFPPLFMQIIHNDPDADVPLHKLWDVYLTHGDLIYAMHVNDDKSAYVLLNFAKNNALTGSNYEGQYLSSSADFYSKLDIQ